VLFLGLPDTEESEGFDREHIDLPGNQLALLRRVAEVHERIVVVLANGSVVRVEGWQQHASALLECWLSGQAAGGAVADLLLGKANPSGRLAETIPLRLEDNPSYLSFPGDSGHVAYGEGIFVGYRGYDRRDQAVSYPFGYGLSYTTFEYAELRVEVSGRHETGDLSIAVSCAITNTGAVAGKEVVQLYVGDAESTVARPVRELCGFAKVALEPGQTTTVTMILTARDLSFWSSVHRQWVLEEGQFELAVGASSRDLRLRRTVYIDAPRLATPLGPMSTLQEWLADPDGAMALAGLFAAAPSGLELDENVLRMMGAFPLSTLATFPGTGLTPENLDELIASVNPLS